MTRMQPPRSVAFIGYLMFALAGCFFMFWTPSVGLKLLLGGVGYYVWNWFLILGGAAGMIGSASKNFRVEIIGTPLLWSSTGAYALSLLPRLASSPSPGGLAGLASIFMGVAFLMLGHMIVLWRRMRVAADIDRRTRPHGQ